VTVAEAVAREIEYVIESTGSIEASEEISIPARVSGVIDALHFKEGNAVDDRTVLLEIEVEKFRLGEEKAQAECERARAQAELSEKLYGNRLKLYDEGKKQQKEWVTEEQMATWLADAKKAKADLERAKADLELARRDHRNARVRSPIRGLINRKLVSTGEFVRAETVVATILNISTLHVRFTVPELEASRLAPGQEILFEVRSAPGLSFKGRLFYLSQKAEQATRTVECKAEVLEKSDAFRAGYFAKVTIVAGRQKSVAVPESAVVHSEKGFLVYATDGKKVQARPVKLGLRVEGRVEITDGLREGERIVVVGALTLRDGQEVELSGGGP
jgi:membrane fusion protein (multidrug efflux system)/multidrug efflux system membrane fusion protein